MKPENRPLILLVVAICATIYILISGPILIEFLPTLLTQVFGVLLIVWAILSAKLNKKHDEHNTLPKGHFLVMKGPYEIIRHPIYLGILLLALGAVHGYPTMLRYLAFIVLVVAILVKMTHEEQLLEQHSKSFEAYKKQTHKLIPWLF